PALWLFLLWTTLLNLALARSAVIKNAASALDLYLTEGKLKPSDLDKCGAILPVWTAPLPSRGVADSAAILFRQAYGTSFLADWPSFAVVALAILLVWPSFRVSELALVLPSLMDPITTKTKTAESVILEYAVLVFIALSVATVFSWLRPIRIPARPGYQAGGLKRLTRRHMFALIGAGLVAAGIGMQTLLGDMSRRSVLNPRFRRRKCGRVRRN